MGLSAVSPTTPAAASLRPAPLSSSQSSGLPPLQYAPLSSSQSSACPLFNTLPSRPASNTGLTLETDPETPDPLLQIDLEFRRLLDVQDSS